MESTHFAAVSHTNLFHFRKKNSVAKVYVNLSHLFFKVQNTVAEKNTIFIPKAMENRKIECFFPFNQAFRFWCIFRLKSFEHSTAVMYNVKKLSHRLVQFPSSDSMRMISKSVYWEHCHCLDLFSMSAEQLYLMHRILSSLLDFTSSFHTYWETERKSCNRNTEKKNLQVYCFKTTSAWPFMKNGLKTEFSGCECKG